MMEIFENFTFGLILGIAAALSPGALLALLISETLRGNIKNGILVSISPIITDIPILFVAIFIIKKLENFEILLGIISIIGAFILFYLGYKNLTEKDFKLKTDLKGSLKKGVIINILNPYTYLFWFFIGAPYISDKGHFESGVFVLTFFIGISGTMILIAFFIDKIKVFIESKYYFYLLKFIGFIFIIFGVMLSVRGFKYIGI
ncbi:LysE family translocator [Persephonella sp.]